MWTSSPEIRPYRLFVQAAYLTPIFTFIGTGQPLVAVVIMMGVKEEVRYRIRMGQLWHRGRVSALLSEGC